MIYQAEIEICELCGNTACAAYQKLDLTTGTGFGNTISFQDYEPSCLGTRLAPSLAPHNRSGPISSQAAAYERGKDTRVESLTVSILGRTGEI